MPFDVQRLQDRGLRCRALRSEGRDSLKIVPSFGIFGI